MQPVDMPIEGEAIIAARALLATVFAMAAVAKLRSWEPFVNVLRFLAPSVGDGARLAVAKSVVGLEGGFAAALVAGFELALVFAASTVFLLGASTALLVLGSRGYEGGCACFGETSARHSSAVRALWRNAMLLIVSAIGFVGGLRADSTPPMWTLGVSDAALIAFLVVATLLAYGMIDGLAWVAAARREAASEVPAPSARPVP